MLTPQLILKDFKSCKYVKENYNFLLPAYADLYKEMGNKIVITKVFKKEVSELLKYFNYIISFKNYKKQSNKTLLIESIVVSISNEMINNLIKTTKKIVGFLYKNRSNINGLEVIMWTFFNKTSLDEIISTYFNDENSDENIKSILINPAFINFLLEYKNFARIAIHDLLTPVEVINPKRRQGGFDKKVFKMISEKLAKKIDNFLFEDKIDDFDLIKEQTNWLITEKTTKKINFPTPKRGKKVDMLCKIGDILFIGTHKEQQSTGGAQDNQATDAGFIFDYRDKELVGIKKDFNVKKICLCIFLERGNKPITSRFWQGMFRMVEQKNNEDKYILSSFQFINLVLSI